MKDVSPATFNLRSYTINQFSFSAINGEEDELAMKFDPSGEFDEATGKFTLTLSFELFEGDPEKNPNINSVISMTMISIFSFSEKISFKKIPPFFYRNSLAIIFPYMRAFVSTLTLQANMRPIIIPVMNLTALEEDLRGNTIVREV